MNTSRFKTTSLLLTCTLAASSVTAHADFTYQESAQTTRGSIIGMMKMVGTFSKAARQIGDPIVTTVMVKGNRMARISKDRSEIIDLDKGYCHGYRQHQEAVHRHDLQRDAATHGSRRIKS